MPPLHPEQGIESFNKQAMTAASLAQPITPVTVTSGNRPDVFLSDWDDEDYFEPDFSPPAHSAELLGLHIGNVEVRLSNETIEDRIKLQIAVFGSKEIQKGELETAEEDGWFELIDEGDAGPPRMIFKNNHQTFASRYRIGYSRLLEMSLTEIRRANETGHWNIDVDPKRYEEMVMRRAVDLLPRGFGRRVPFDNSGMLYTRNHDNNRISLEEYVAELESSGVDFLVHKLPLNCSFILVNDKLVVAEKPEAEVEDAKIIEFPRSNAQRVAGNLAVFAVAGGA